jgi:hypothetical protein
MRVLVACERSGVVRQAFRDRGHNAWSCDLEPADDGSDWHICDDVREVLGEQWDLIIAHPDCTYLTNSGVRHLYKHPGKNYDRSKLYGVPRWKAMFDAAAFFRLFLEVSCPRVCVENPIPHRYARDLIRMDYTQIVQPWQFGHSAKKATCLWLKGLTPLRATEIVPRRDRKPTIHMMSGKDRSRRRSVTFSGIAAAMADQWGDEE